jgi:hypothetical protein
MRAVPEKFSIPKTILIQVETANQKRNLVRVRVHGVQARDEDGSKAWSAMVRWKQRSMRVLFRTDPQHALGLAAFRKRDGKPLAWACADGVSDPEATSAEKRSNARTSTALCDRKHGLNSIARRRPDPVPAATSTQAPSSTDTEKQCVHADRGLDEAANASTSSPVLFEDEPSRMRLRSHSRQRAPEHADTPPRHDDGKRPLVSRRPFQRIRKQRISISRNVKKHKQQNEMNQQVATTAAAPALRTICKSLATQYAGVAHTDLVRFLQMLQTQLEANFVESHSSEKSDVMRLKRELLAMRLAFLDQATLKHTISSPLRTTLQVTVPGCNHRPRFPEKYSRSLAAAALAYVRCLETEGVRVGAERPLESVADAMGLLAQDTIRLIHEKQIDFHQAGSSVSERVQASELRFIGAANESLGQLILSQTQVLISMLQVQTEASERWERLAEEVGRCATQALVQAQCKNMADAHYRHALRELVQHFPPSDAPVYYGTAMVTVLERALAQKRVQSEQDDNQMLARALIAGPDLFALASGIEHLRRKRGHLPEQTAACTTIDPSLSIRWHQSVLRLCQIGAKTMAMHLLGCAQDICGSEKNRISVCATIHWNDRTAAT